MATFAVALPAFVFFGRGQVEDAGSVETTAAPAPTVPPASTIPPPATTVPTPESTTTTRLEWVSINVTMPQGAVAGVLVTDGHHAHRLLPGEVGRAVIGVPMDPTSVSTFLLGGQSWRVFNRGSVAANNLAGLTGPWPVVPVVLLVSTVPGDQRLYVEATANG